MCYTNNHALLWGLLLFYNVKPNHKLSKTRHALSVQISRSQHIIKSLVYSPTLLFLTILFETVFDIYIMIDSVYFLEFGIDNKLLI